MFLSFPDERDRKWEIQERAIGIGIVIGRYPVLEWAHKPVPDCTSECSFLHPSPASVELPLVILVVLPPSRIAGDELHMKMIIIGGQEANE